MRRCNSMTSAICSEDAESHVRYVERRLQTMSNEVEYLKETLDFRTAVVTALVFILYILNSV